MTPKIQSRPGHWLEQNCRLRPDGIWFDGDGNWYRPATTEEAQHGLNDTWLGDPIPVAPPPDPSGLEALVDHYRFGLEMLACTFYKEDQHQDYAKHILSSAPAAESRLAAVVETRAEIIEPSADPYHPSNRGFDGPTGAE